MLVRFRLHTATLSRKLTSKALSNHRNNCMTLLSARLGVPLSILHFTPHGRHAGQGAAQHYLRAQSISFTAHPRPSPRITSRRPLSFLNRFLPAASGKPDDPSTSSALKSLIALTKPERGRLGIGIGLLLISSSISLSVPFTIGRLIDYFAAEHHHLIVSIPSTLVDFMSLPTQIELSPTTAAVTLFSLFTIGALSNAGRSLIFRMAGQRIVARLRQKTYESALRQEVEFVEKGEGDIVSRLSVDSSIVGEAVTGNVSDGLRAIITASVGLGAMFYLSPQLTALMLALVPPVSLGAVVYGRYIKRLSNKTQEAIGDMTKTASEALNSLRTVQAYTATAYESGKFSERIDVILQLARKEALATAAFFGATGWSGNVTLLCLLGYGGSLVSKGMISVGDLTSLLLYSVYVGGGLQSLSSFFSSIMRAIGASTRIFSLISRVPDIQPFAVTAKSFDPSRRGVLKFDSVSFQYPSRKDVEILKQFNLEVGVGESVALVGSSGSGKSSAHALLLRFYDPVEGTVTYDGEDIRNFTTDSWRRVIGVVPQDPVLFTGTIASNIAYGNTDATQAEIESAAQLANCDFIQNLPMGFETKIGRMSLSGGQRQRLAIARALLKKPAILALDEATSALDAGSEMRVNEAIDKILSDTSTTCFIVAHRLSTIARAERIVVLEDGHIVEAGAYQALASDPNSRFRRLMAAQLETTATRSTRSFKPKADA